MAIRGLERPDKAALLISECQNGMTNPEFTTNAPLVEQITKYDVISNIATLADAFREFDLPVFHNVVRPAKEFRAWPKNSLLTSSIAKRPLTEGQPSVDIHPDLTPQERDFVITRRIGLTMFHGTELEQLLRNLGVETLVLTGVSLNVALLGSTIEAINRGFSVILPHDCVAAATDETREFLLENIYRILTTPSNSVEIIDELRASLAA